MIPALPQDVYLQAILTAIMDTTVRPVHNAANHQAARPFVMQFLRNIHVVEVLACLIPMVATLIPTVTTLAAGAAVEGIVQVMGIVRALVQETVGGAAMPFVNLIVYVIAVKQLIPVASPAHKAVKLPMLSAGLVYAHGLRVEPQINNI